MTINSPQINDDVQNREANNLASKRKLRWIYRKFSQAGFAVALIAIVIGLWNSTTQRGIKTFEKHAYLLVRQVVKQAQLPVILNKDNLTAAISQQLVEHLADSNFIIDATLYSNDGQTLAQSQQAFTLKQAVGIEAVTNKMRLFTIVEPIEVNGKNMGYLRVTFDYDAVQQDSKEFQEDFSGRTRLMLFLCAIIGFLFSRAFSRENRN
ncbi:AhpA/YtjB family protein [Algibacillus agarilyticus]|uniref:AhpA/YtjB family protein n=1 Tax=Algibacillus agarilyticus TaxID=2234133 RepID=UPI0013002620|nr:AhpA/YtjB family protein [Algibacillus agarilyticus]